MILAKVLTVLLSFHYFKVRYKNSFTKQDMHVLFVIEETQDMHVLLSKAHLFLKFVIHRLKVGYELQQKM